MSGETIRRPQGREASTFESPLIEAPSGISQPRRSGVAIATPHRKLPRFASRATRAVGSFQPRSVGVTTNRRCMPGLRDVLRVVRLIVARRWRNGVRMMDAFWDRRTNFWSDRAPEIRRRESAGSAAADGRDVSGSPRRTLASLCALAVDIAGRVVHGLVASDVGRRPGREQEAAQRTARARRRTRGKRAAAAGPVVNATCRIGAPTRRRSGGHADRPRCRRSRFSQAPVGAVAGNSGMSPSSAPKASSPAPAPAPASAPAPHPLQHLADADALAAAATATAYATTLHNRVARDVHPRQWRADPVTTRVRLRAASAGHETADHLEPGRGLEPWPAHYE